MLSNPGSKLCCELIDQIRVAALSHRNNRMLIHRLIAVEAWTEAALTLVELELPGWTVRRLVHEDGEWHCSLSRQPSLPIELDHMATGTCPALALAILMALTEAHRLVTEEPTATPANQHTQNLDPVCCENFF